jgi:hypothetical protein
MPGPKMLPGPAPTRDKARILSMPDAALRCPVAHCPRDGRPTGRSGCCLALRAGRETLPMYTTAAALFIYLYIGGVVTKSSRVMFRRRRHPWGRGHAPFGLALTPTKSSQPSRLVCFAMQTIQYYTTRLLSSISLVVVVLLYYTRIRFFFSVFYGVQSDMLLKKDKCVAD